MDCKIVTDNILFYLDKELDEDLRIQFEDHLAQCADCKELYQKVEATYGSINLVKELDPDPFFYTRFEARLEKQQENRAVHVFFNVLKPLAVAASIALGIFIGNGELDLLTIPDNEIELASEEFAPVLPSDYSVWITMNEDNGSTN
ncbi:MAG: zf-HC2 domain-containing protein [Bacteroidota bacterium]